MAKMSLLAGSCVDCINSVLCGTIQKNAPIIIPTESTQPPCTCRDLLFSVHSYDDIARVGLLQNTKQENLLRLTK